MNLGKEKATVSQGTVLINLVSAQPVPSLIPVLDTRFGVDEVVLLVTAEMRRQAERLKRVCRRHEIVCQIWPEDAPAYDPQGMEEMLLDLIAGYPEGRSLLLNATGGTKIMALTAANLFASLDRGDVIYVDTAQGLIHKLYPSREKAWPMEAALGLSDYLSAYGMHPKKPARAWRRGEALPALPASAQFLAENAERLDSLLGLFNFAGSGVLAAERQAEPWPRIMPLERPFPETDFNRRLLERLGRDELVLVEKSLITFPTEAAARYLSGGWLEEYTFARACGAGADEVVLSQVVDWDGGGEQPLRNEFDCLLIRDNRLYLLECKTMRFAEKTSEVLYKLDSLKERSAGLFGRGALVSARQVRDEMRRRATGVNCRIFAPAELGDLRKHLRAWLESGS